MCIKPCGRLTMVECATPHGSDPVKTRSNARGSAMVAVRKRRSGQATVRLKGEGSCSVDMARAWWGSERGRRQRQVATILFER